MLKSLQLTALRPPFAALNALALALPVSCAGAAAAEVPARQTGGVALPAQTNAGGQHSASAKHPSATPNSRSAGQHLLKEVRQALEAGSTQQALQLLRLARTGGVATPHGLVEEVLNLELALHRQLGDFKTALALTAEAGAVFDQATVDELRHERAVQLIKDAAAHEATPVVKERLLEEAVGLLTGITADSPRRSGDLFIAFVEQGHFARALSFYTDSPELAWPRWVRPSLAKAYSGAKQYDRARLLYGQLSREQPEEFQHWAGLFYALSDLAQTEDAKQLADELVERFPTGPHAATARLLQVNSRHWAGDTLGAMALVRRALVELPLSTELSTAQGWLLLALGKHEAGLKRFEAVLKADPGYLEARLGQVAALRELAPSTAHAALVELRKEHPHSPRVAKAATDFETERRGYVYADSQQNADRDSASRSSSVEVATPAFDDAGSQLVVSRTTYAYDLKDGAIRAGSSAVGLTTRVGNSQVTLQVSQNDQKDTGAGLVLRIRTRVSDDWQLTAAADTAFGGVPARAVQQGISAKRIQLGARWAGAQRWEAGASVEATHLSDDNIRRSFSAYAAWRPISGMTLTTRGGVDTATRTDVAYFSPSRASWAELSTEWVKPLPVGLPNPVKLGVSASIGALAQDGYVVLGYGSIGVSSAMDITSNLGLKFAVQKVRRPYDGAQTSQDLWSASLFWRMP